MTITALQITKIDNGWIVGTQGQQNEKPMAFYCEDTFEVYALLKKILPLEDPKIIKPK